jgi:5-methylcytosine-specific restriction endonuclease McrA
MAEGEYRRLACRHCGDEFVPLKSTAMYCTKRCKHAAWRSANPERWREHRQADNRKRHPCSAVFAGYCRECGGAFVSRRERPFCSDVCYRKANHKASYVSTAPAVRTCVTCGGKFEAPPFKTRPTDFCGAECRRAAVRAQKVKRKARERGAAVETVNPFKVFARDGWLCQLCGIKTPQAKRGTCEPDAPELDHIVPLARGGEHSYRNTQCACRRCNGLKRDKPLGQLLLVG